MKFICVIMAIGALLALPFRLQAELADGIKAVVHNSIITYQDVENSTMPVLSQLRQQYGSEPQVFQKKLSQALDDNLERLVENRLILHEFETEDYNLPESVIDEQIRSYIRSNYGDDRIRFIRTLQAEGKTYEEFRKEFRDRFIIQQMRLSHEQKATIVSPHKIEVYYHDHADQFKVEEQVKLRMIVLTNATEGVAQTRELANEILTQLKQGASFKQMASVYSQGSQRSEGGQWGWVEKSVLRKELAAVAFKLKPGQISGVIQTPEACYLMLVEDKRPTHTEPLNQVRDQIEQTLLTQEHARMQKQWIDRLKKKTFIRYF